MYALLAACGLTLALATAPARAQQFSGGSLTAVPEIGIDQKLDAQVPLDLTFQNESGKTIRLGDYFGQKPVIVVMPFYKCAGSCTLELNGLAKAMRDIPYKMPDDYQVVTVSIDPTEGPELAFGKKQAYTALYNKPGAQQGWHFLTGKQENIIALAKALGNRYMINLNAKPPQIQHATGLFFLTPQGKISRYMFGVDYNPRDLKFALLDASNSKIGSLTEQLLVRCYMYDPHSGKYSLQIVRLLQIAGIATVISLASSVMLMLRWEKRRNLNAEASAETPAQPQG